MKRAVLLAIVCLLHTAMVVRPARAAVLDLTEPGSFGAISGAIFRQYSDTATGSGNIDAFLRIQGFGIQQGYNTDYRGPGFPEFDEDSTLSFTHSLVVGEIPIVKSNGDYYRELLLDINQNGENILSLDELRIALHGSADLFGYSAIFSSPIYDLDAGEDNWIKLDYSLNGGSGQGDMLVYLPDSLFSGADEYVYVYSKFGENSPADDGFEEWAHGVGLPVIPEPVTLLLLATGGLVILRQHRRV